MNFSISLMSEFQLLLKLYILYIIFSLIFVMVYFFFYNNNIFNNNFEKKNKRILKIIILFFITSISLFGLFYINILNLFLYNNFLLNLSQNNFLARHYFLVINIFPENNFNLFTFTINKFNLIFFLLFFFLFPFIFIIMSYDYINIKIYIYIYIIFVLSFFLLIIENVILFYFIYELLLILVFYSMYLSANTRGGVEAALYFAGWAILGSILVGVAFILLIILTNCSYFYLLKFNKLNSNETYYIYLLFFLGFGVKLSVWPFWYWLPKAHVEVSTGMSIFLSCILIKLSLFCLLRVQHVLLSEISFNICIFFSFICSIDIVFRFINLRDLKAIVAYGSVLHTNLLIALIHLDSFKVLKSSVFYIWGHSLSTTSLFIIINVLESRYSSRNILYISGVWYSSPILGYLIFFNLLSFLDLPISLFFWGELWLWVISIEQLFLLSIQVLFLVNVVFTSIFFKVWWCILFGTPDVSIKKINSNDLNYEANLILIWLAFIQFILGIQPGILSYISGLYI